MARKADVPGDFEAKAFGVQAPSIDFTLEPGADLTPLIRTGLVHTIGGMVRWEARFRQHGSAHGPDPYDITLELAPGDRLQIEPDSDEVSTVFRVTRSR